MRKTKDDSCLTCRSIEGVREISFSNSSSSLLIPLCSKCRVELVKAIFPVSEGTNDCVTCEYRELQGYEFPCSDCDEYNSRFIRKGD